ncbi:MAG TPA: hypothetical protein DCY02_10590 [Armatimonadetes bacterium]|nr:hypothetical protein [Armatimonadota bacterium]HCM73704.1 hypothetical protein [Armatimonadota bacterium]
MHCEGREAMISALVDGELMGREMLEMKAHMAECPACQAAYEELRSLKMGMALLMMPEVSDESFDRVKAGFEAKLAAQTGPRTPRHIWTGMAAASLLAVVLATWMANPRGTNSVTEFDESLDQAYAAGAAPAMGSTPIVPANYSGW